jgi:hypothetical protein
MTLIGSGHSLTSCVDQYSAETQSQGPDLFGPYLYGARKCRRVAIRYDKLAANYQAFIKLASIRVWLRQRVRALTWTRDAAPRPNDVLVATSLDVIAADDLFDLTLRAAPIINEDDLAFSQCAHWGLCLED